MELPKIKSKNKNLEKFYGLMMTPQMKDRLVQMKTFGGYDTSEWIRGMIQEQFDQIDKKKANELELPYSQSVSR